MAQGVGAAWGSHGPTSQTPMVAGAAGGSSMQSVQNTAAQNLLKAALPCSEQIAQIDASSPDQAPAAASSLHSTVEEIKNILLNIFEDLETLDWATLYNRFNSISKDDVRLPYFFNLYYVINSFQQNLKETQMDFSIDSYNEPFPSLTSIFFIVQRLEAQGPTAEIAQSNITDFLTKLPEDNLRNVQNKLNTLTDLISKEIDDLDEKELCYLLLLDTINYIRTIFKAYIVLITDTSEFKKLTETEFLDNNQFPRWQDAFNAFLEKANKLKSEHSELTERLNQIILGTEQQNTLILFIHNLIPEINLINKELSTKLHEIVKSHTDEITSLQATIKSLQKKNHDLETKMPNLKATIEEKEKSIQSLRKEITMQEKNILGLNSQLAQKYEEYDELQKKQFSLVENYTQLEKEKIGYTGKLQELESLIKVLEDKNKNQKDEYSKHVDLMGNQVQRIRDLTEQNDNLKDQLAKTYEEVKAQNAVLQTKNAEIQLKADEIKKLQHTIGKFNTHNSGIEQQLSNLMDDFAKVKEKVDNQNAVLQQKDAEIEELQHTIKDFEASRAKMEQHLSELTGDLENVTNKHDQLSAQKTLDALQHEVNKKNQDQKIEILQNENAEKNAELQEQKAVIADRNAVIAEKNAELAQKKEEINAQNAVLQTKADEIQKLQLTIEKSETHNSGIAQRLDDLEDDFAQARKKVDDQTAELQTQAAKIEALQNENKKKDAEIEELKRQLTEKQGSPQKPLSHHGQHAVSAQNQTLKNEIKTLKNEIKTLKDVFSGLDDICKELAESNSAFNFQFDESAESNYQEKINRLISYLELIKKENQDTSTQLNVLTSTNERLSTENKTSKSKSEEIHSKLVAICEKFREKIGIVPTIIMNLAGGHTNAGDDKSDFRDKSIDVLLDIILERLDSLSKQRRSSRPSLSSDVYISGSPVTRWVSLDSAASSTLASSASSTFRSIANDDKANLEIGQC